MAFQETTTTGYGKRIGNSFKGIVFGFILFAVGTGILFWNEGSYVKTQKAINEGEKNVVALSDITTVDASNNGKLIHASGFADTKDSISDDQFGAKDLAISLNRKVEYYQWVEKTKSEKKDKIGGGQEEVKTYTYKQEWVNKPVDSKEFKDPQYQNANFVLTSIESKETQATDVSFGAYNLPTFIISSINGNEPVKLSLSEEQKENWEKNISRNIPAGTENVKTTDSTTEKKEYFHINENVAYIGKSPSNPMVGDVRVTITKSAPTDISIIAKINGNTFEPYITKNGKNISQVVKGKVSAENMFASAHSSNSTMTWILRLVGMVMVIFGLKSMFSIVVTLFKVIPFLSNIVGAGVGLVVTLIGFAWSVLIIAMAWLFYRPLIAGLLIALIVGAIVFLKKRASSKKVANPVPDIRTT